MELGQKLAQNANVLAEPQEREREWEREESRAQGAGLGIATTNFAQLQVWFYEQTAPGAWLRVSSTRVPRIK